MPRFVILSHEKTHEVPHYDFMLEEGDVLLTWSFLPEPVEGVVASARHLPDHRLHYLDYEGSVSGDRGIVSRWDEGTYEVLEQDDSRRVVQLHGRRLSCRVAIEHAPGQDEGDGWSVKFC